MPTQIQLSVKDPVAWIQAMGLKFDSATLDAFQGSLLEALYFEPETQTLRLTLSLASAPENTNPFDALRAELKKLDFAHMALCARYTPGCISTEEYLALHFDDMLLRLAAELALAPDWTSRLEYRFGGDLSEERVELLVPTRLIAQALQQRQAALRLAEHLGWALGQNPTVSIVLDESLQPASAPILPAVTITLASNSSAPSNGGAPKGEAFTPGPAKKVADGAWFGRLISPGKPREIASLLQVDRDVMIEGELFGFSIRPTKTEGAWFKFAVTDGSDSITCKFFVRPGEDRPKELPAGARVRVRGPLQSDDFEKDELVLMASAVTRLPPALLRQDLAVEKRIELHAHTKMSASDSVVDIEQYILRAAQWGHAAVGVTDHGVVHAFPLAAKAAKKAGIKLLLGMEAYLVEDVAFLEERDKKKVNAPTYFHAILYAANELGRRHLYDLVSHSHTRSYYRKPLIARDLLISKREGLILGSACEQGELIQAILEGADDARLESIAGFYDYLEVQPLGNNEFLLRTGQASSQEDLKNIVRKVIALAQRLGKPVVATSDMHYLDPQDEVYRRILQVGIGMQDGEQQPPLYFHTTDEMLAEFAWLEDTALIHKIVVEDPKRVADMIGDVPPVPPVPKDNPGLYFPEMEGAAERVESLSRARAEQVYGTPLPPLVLARLEKELNTIIGKRFAVPYEIARQLVEESNKLGYSVGSRGSVGSSVVAWLLRVSEVNPLAAHVHCPACHWVEFYEAERQVGVDLLARACPQCGGSTVRDGFNIPFESFVGFKGDKVPDIDLNFAPEVQSIIQKYAETLFGEGRAFKAGTISTMAEKTAFGFAKKYFEAKGVVKRKAEIERLKAGLEGVKKTSGQHPGGVILVRHDCDINDFTPVQFPADGNERGGSEKANEGSLLTTHFDYHAIDECLVKLDILGKDDASAFKHLQELTEIPETSVPLDDALALSLFNSAKALGLPKLTEEERELFGDTGALALPEFGTANTRRMLEATRPKNFTELIYVSGLSHGTNVWTGNAELLIKEKKATLDTVISTRDEIMIRLIDQGMEASMAFAITEKVRKGKAASDGFSPAEDAALKAAKLPAWWIESCKKIKYMFPKAHAAAYCFTAVRMAYFKVHHPAAFYAAWLTVKGEAAEGATLSQGKVAVQARLRQLRQQSMDKTIKTTAKDEDTLNAMTVAFEAVLRGIQFKAVDLYLSHPFRFQMVDDRTLLPPLVCLAGLGETAANNIERERQAGPFKSVEDLAERASLNKTVIEKLQTSGALDILPKTNQITLF